MFVNCEKLIPYFNLVFFCVFVVVVVVVFVVFFFFFFFLVLGGERHKMGVKRLIYPSFLTEVGNKD